jgi:arabinogalactan endo-1,4-beta-galactosidase
MFTSVAADGREQETMATWQFGLHGFVVAIVYAAVCVHAAEPLVVGVDANYSLAMERAGQSWKFDGATDDLFRGMARSGAKAFRVRLWIGEEIVNGTQYALEVVKRATAAGLDPYLVIFLSDDWADMVKQPAPAVWKDLDLEKRAEAVREYSREMVATFRAAGLTNHLYEIGNEIDYGICGVYPGKSTKKNPESLSRRHWPDAATLIRASQEGVRAADPEAKFMLHIAHWWDREFCIGFFRFMLDAGVQVDYAGLSYFPSSNIGGSLEMAQFGDVVSALHAAIDRPVIVPETAYPSTAEFKGQFSRWKKETPGYPLTPAGQQRWLQDFLAFAAHHPAIHSVYYWSPEWCGEGMWKAFALFDVSGEARPAWAAMQGVRAETPRRSAYLQVRGDDVFVVPVEEIKAAARPALREEFDRSGMVNVPYIQAITARELTVGDYRVNLRASLMNNLDAVVQAERPTSDWRDVVSGLDPARQQLVVYTAAPDSKTTRNVVAVAQERKLKTLVHENADDRPIKLGFDEQWKPSAAE